MKTVSTAEMAAIETEADAAGLTYAQMMQNAGEGVARIVDGMRLHTDQREVLGLVGPGNNGGDTLVALCNLAAAGWRTGAYLVNRKTDPLVERLQQLGGTALLALQDKNFAGLEGLLQTARVVIDGVLGTGSKPPLRGAVSAVLEAVQRFLGGQPEAPYIVAVDCPSGTDCDTGEVAPQSLAADLTVTIAAAKRGLLKMPAFGLVGELQAVDIGLSPSLRAWPVPGTEMAQRDEVAALLPARPMDAHKGTFGTALIVAGSVNYTGAAWLAGKAAYRAGAGLVTLAVPGPLHAALAGHLPEATWILLPDAGGVISREGAVVAMASFPGVDAVLVGPGIGTRQTTQDFMTALLSAGPGPGKAGASTGRRTRGRGRQAAHRLTMPPAVVDADGLRLLAGIKDWNKLLPPHSVLTPHPGEMSFLTSIPKDEIQRDRESVAQKFARAWDHIVVLKGALTVVASPDGRTTIIPIASAALARAGTGDVLAGLIVGLRAQGLEAYEAAVAGAWIHGRAGLQAARAAGNTASVLAGDVLASIPEVMRELTIRTAAREADLARNRPR
jgi:NAD(P)H-hydrate epimerase